MKKAFILIIIFLTLILTSAPPVFAVQEEITNEEYYSDALLSAVDRDTLKVLEEIGIEDFTAQEIFSVSFDEIGKYFSTDILTKFKENLSDFFLLLCVIVVLTTVKSFFFSDDAKYVSCIGIIAVTLISIQTLDSVVNMLINSLKSGNVFMLSFVPIYTVLLSLSGSVSSAVTYNTVTFAFAQGLSSFINSLIVDVLGIFLSVSIAFSLNSVTNLNRFVLTANKLVNTVIGFASSCFAAVLSVRGVFSMAVDSVSSKSVKFLISNLIPIVGSSISDAYSTLLGSINVIKSSVAAVGIIVILIITIPPIIEGAIYCLFFSFLSYISDISELNEVSSILRALSSAVRTLILLNVFQIFLITVSTAIMLTVKGGI